MSANSLPLKNTGFNADRVLNQYLVDCDACFVEIRDPGSITSGEIGRITQIMARNNFVFYQCHKPLGEIPGGLRFFCQQLGLQNSIPNPAANDENITCIKAVTADDQNSKPLDVRQRYIPFTNRELGWHTDGYYNEDDRRVASFVLHCRQPASEGGENCFIDPRVVYALLMQKNPDWVAALSRPDMLYIPKNEQHGEIIREAFSGPVFSFHTQDQTLHTRYTERKHHIQWCSDENAQTALTEMRGFIQTAQWQVAVKLQAGQGVISNNALHCRSAYVDSPDKGNTRQLYRMRFLDRYHGIGN